jgi:4-amino-4-deoxy-L-arabinose transferase-like glycosyltransferase
VATESDAGEASRPARRRPRVGMRALAGALVLLLAFALRLGEVKRTAYKPINDGGVYLRLGGEIAHLGSYSSSDRGAGGSRGPSAYFPPGYPYFIAAVDLLDGHRTPRGGAIEGVRLAQALLGTATVAVIGLVAFELLGATLALIAMAIAAVYPVMIELTGVLVAENLLTPLVLAAIWTVLRARRSAGRRRYGWLAAGGVLAGLATLTHVNGALVLPALLIGVWGPRPRLSPRSLAAPAVVLAAAVIVVVPWTIRNAVVLHHFIPVTDETGITLVGTYNPASAANHQVPYKWRLFFSIPGERPLVRAAPRISESELDSRLRTQALHYIGNHPLSPIAVAFHNTLRLFELEGSFAWHASAAAIGLDAGTARIGVIGFWLLCLLALAGAFTRAARSVPWWVWLVPVLLALSVVLVNVETPRFRAPVDPFLVLLAACGVSAAVSRLEAAIRARRTSGLSRAPVGSGFEAPPTRGDGELVQMVERLA